MWARTLFVGRSFGRPLSQRPVCFVSGCPCSHGWMYWSALRIRVPMAPGGFSRAIRGIGALSNALTNSRASSCSALRSGHHLEPARVRWVHGGWAIIKSHPLSSSARTSPCTCQPCGESLGSRSQLTAVCPRLAKASRTLPLYSQETNTRMLAQLKKPLYGGLWGWGVDGPGLLPARYCIHHQ